MKITYFFRKFYSTAYSIEELFEGICDHLRKNESAVTGTTIKVPFFSRSVIEIIKNIAFARRHQSEINHITGDIHYVMLGLSPKNYNILTIHDCAFMYRFPKHSFRYWVFKWLWIRWPVKKADVVTTISEKTRADIIRFSGCDPEKVKIIPNYVNPVFSYSVPEPGYAHPRILHLGTDDNKNLSRVIQALEGINCTLDIIGPLNYEYPNLLLKYKINYENSTSLSLEAVAKHYKMSNMVIFASTFEGFGMPIIEANCTGRPVITSNLSPMIEVADGAGHLVDPFNVEDIRNGILKIINDLPYRNSLIAKGLQNAVPYNLESVANQYLTLYHNKPDKKRHVRNRRSD